jgi:hypothetical protein
MLRRESRCLLGIVLSVLVSVSTACTTGRMLQMQTQPGATAPRGLKSGDRIRVHTHDGKHSDFDFDHVSAQSDVFGQRQEHVRAADIAMVERRSINKVRTTLLLAAVGISAVLVIAIVEFSNGLLE